MQKKKKHIWIQRDGEVEKAQQIKNANKKFNSHKRIYMEFGSNLL